MKVKKTQLKSFQSGLRMEVSQINGKFKEETNEDDEYVSEFENLEMLL